VRRFKGAPPHTDEDTTDADRMGRRVDEHERLAQDARERGPATGALVGHTLDGRVVFANDVFCEHHHVRHDELPEREPWFWAGLRDPESRQRIRETILEHGHHTFDTPGLEGAEGGPWRVQSWLATLDGQPIVVSALTDVSEQYETARALDFTGMLLDEVSDAVVCHTLDGRIVYANQAASAERGYTREEFLRLRVSDLISPEAAVRYGALTDRLVRDGSASFESEDVTADGRRMTVEVNARMVDVGGEPIVIAVARDISERKRAQEAVERVAFHDPLTGLPNRRLLMQRLEEALEHAREIDERVAVYFIDLDHLKHINDRFGHAVGDRVLEIAALRLAAIVRVDDTVARLGGDEFVVVVTGLADDVAVERVAGKLLSVFGEAFDIDGRAVTSTASIGVAVNRPGEIGALELLGNADIAMYTVKDSSRNSYAAYEPGMRIRAGLAGLAYVDTHDIEAGDA
jgi:diguanylate cyclase (GGDEF)-like protein/PAS domain S-box-containing protein